MLNASVKKHLITVFALLVMGNRANAQPKDCGPDQADILNRFNYVYKEVWKETLPGTNPQTPTTPVTSNPPRIEPTSGIGSGRIASIPDARSTGSYYYDMRDYRPLTPREDREAKKYEQAVIQTRTTPVSYNTPGIGATQKQEIAQILDRMGVKYDKNTNTIPPSNSRDKRVTLEDRVRKIVLDTMRGPITDINYSMDVLRDRIIALENATQNEKDPQWKNLKSKQVKGPADRMLASIPNAVPPEKAALNPLDLDEIVNKALYIRDGAHWQKSQSLSEKDSKDPISKGGIAKEIFRSMAIADGTEIRVLELINKKDEVVGIKIFIHRPDKNVWVPVFYKPDPQTQQFVRQTTYHGDRLPYACLNCHGGSLRKMGPQVELSNWPKTSKK